MTSIDIAVFAHNEEAGIADCVAALRAQDLLARTDLSVRLMVLANGCTDGTAARAAAPGVEVVELEQGGKSRTWTAFVHGLARADADFLIFCDADIAFADPGTLSGLLETVITRPGVVASSSRPVKDIVHSPQDLGPVDRLIASAGGTLDDWRTSICGQLYILRGDTARGIHLPAGLPVEDGFVRAMVVTHGFTADEDLSRVDGRDTVFHIYASERGVAALVRHQVRLVIGGAINYVIYQWLESLPAAERPAALARASESDGWLADRLSSALPDRRYGWVPWHFLFKRLRAAYGKGARALTPKALLVTFVGFGFDALVWGVAQVKMARGTGAGHW